MGTRIQLVGSIAVLGDGGVVAGAPLAARRVRLVLAALAVAPDGLSSRALAGHVWEDLPTTWSAALRGTVLALRSALEPIGLGGQELVRTMAGGWAISPGVTVDLLEFGATIGAAERLLAEGAAEAAINVLGPVTDMMRGDLLPEEDLGWIVEWRDRLSALTDRALGIEAEAALILSRYATAVEKARRLLDRNGLDEGAHRILIRALVGSGDRAGAIRAYETCRAVLADELGMDPSDETAQLYLDVLRSGSAGTGNLPAVPRNGFFGRAIEIAATRESLVEPGLVSVVGRGGVGKTRLALQLATAAAAEFPGGRFWVPLGDVSDAALVVVSVARALGADERVDPLAATIARLAPLGPALLVLDGCEAAIDDVAELLAALLAAAPELRVLTTSRRALAVAGERKIELSPLAIPGVDVPLTESSAVQLLVDRLAAKGHRLAIDGSSGPAIRELCIRCGGMPLALELAAAQLGAMAVVDLLDLLPAAAQGAEEVLELLLQQSYEALGMEAASLFMSWGVVNGALPLSLATRLSPAVAGPGRVARLLGELVDGGLLLIDRSGPRWRYHQDDQVRAFAREKLNIEGGAETVLIGLVGGLRDLLPDDPRAPPGGFRDAATEASDGFRTVFSAAIDGDLPRQIGLELAFRLHRYWTVTSMAEGRYWLSLLLDGAPEGEWLPFGSFAAGYLSYWAGDTERAQIQLEEAARRFRGVDDGYAARSLVYAAGIADDRDRPVHAIEDVRTAIELADRTDDVNLQISARISLASILAERGDPEAAVHASRAVERCRGRASEDQLLATLATSALVCWQVGAFEQAREVIAEADPLLTGEPRIARATLAVSAAGIALVDGRLETAARLVEIAVHDGEELGIDRELPLSYSLTARIAAARGHREDAVRAAIAALEQAGRLDFAYPMAICLETAAELLSDSGDVAVLRAAASGIRAAGDRPAPVGLVPSETVAATTGPGVVDEAARRARSALERLLV